MKSIVLTCALCVLACGCGSAAAELKEQLAAPPKQIIVGIDISGSRTPSQLREEQAVIDGLIERMSFGDRIILIETYRTGIDSAGQWQDSIPATRRPDVITGRDRNNLEQFRVVASQMASTFFDPEQSRKVKSTDLFHTLARAADYATSANGRMTTLVLLSDMLQSTAEVNMERAGGVPPDSWINQRKAEGRLPDLHGVCVFVVGADPLSSTGARVRKFWQRYFDATGATFGPANYRNMVADAAELRCR
jgi:hypothetical protein